MPPLKHFFVKAAKKLPITGRYVTLTNAPPKPFIFADLLFNHTLLKQPQANRKKPMGAYSSDFLRILQERGFIHQCTDDAQLDEIMSSGGVPGYIGFDATATSLHAGSLVQIMMLYWLQATGNKPIVLMGGGTSMVGDPSGKDESRKLLGTADINKNIAGIKGVFEKFLTFGDGANDAVMVNNADWLSGLKYIEFLRDYGRHFSVNRMLGFESVKLRLDREQTLSFLEFNYMILQAYDFVELYSNHKCRLQMGGSDQWGNIVNGVELGRRTLREGKTGVELFGLTTPLLTTASGAKMGKTADGAVWLNADMLSPYDYFQYWRNAEDADVGKFLKLFTTLPMDEIAKLEKLEGAEINEAKKILAFEVTRLCHGEAAAKEAQDTAVQEFEKGKAGAASVTVSVSPDATWTETYTSAGLAASNGEVRRLVKGRGLKLMVNDQTFVIEDADTSIADTFSQNGVTVTPADNIRIAKGKKHFAVLDFDVPASG